MKDKLLRKMFTALVYLVEKKYGKKFSHAKIFFQEEHPFTPAPVKTITRTGEVI